MEKKLYLRLSIRNGEYDYSSKTVHVVPDNMTCEQYAEWYAKTFYDGSADEEDGGYYFNGGEVHVRVKDYAEITDSEFKILNTYL